MPTNSNHPADSRFFPDYTWVSDRPDCKTGLCMPGDDPAAAARRFAVHSHRFQYRTTPYICWTLAGPDAEPVRHEVMPG